MTFEEVLDKLGEETETFQVCACGAYSEKGHHDIGIRSGSAPANVDFHDPIIDENVFMICGDIYHRVDHKRVDEIADVKEFPENLLVRLRAVCSYCAGVSMSVDLGVYDILDSEVVKWGDFATDCCVKLTLKRRGY